MSLRNISCPALLPCGQRGGNSSRARYPPPKIYPNDRRNVPVAEEKREKVRSGTGGGLHLPRVRQDMDVGRALPPTSIYRLDDKDAGPKSSIEDEERPASLPHPFPSNIHPSLVTWSKSKEETLASPQQQAHPLSGRDGPTIKRLVGLGCSRRLQFLADDTTTPKIT